LKHLIPVFVLFLIGGALGFISCASHPLKNAAPSVSVSKTQLESRQPASGQTRPDALTASTQPNIAAKMIEITTDFSSSGENSLSLLLLILALLLLWASLRQLRRNPKPAPPLLLAAPTRVLTSPKESLHNGVLLTSAGAVHLLHAKHNYRPIVPANIKNDIWVAAFYYDDMYRMHFAPNTTIKKVTGWAAYQCQISEEYLKEVYLTLRDQFSPLRETAHIARFVPRHRKHLKLEVRVMAPAANPQG
jgi:hypothetical protein